MFWEPVAAVSVSIFLTILLFLVLYLSAYSIVWGAVEVAKMIKSKLKELRETKDDMPS